MSKHTPGPWKWWTSCSFRRLSSEATGQDGDVLHGVVQHSDGHTDVVLPNGGWNGPDGRLIAAAPCLLDALDEILNYSGGADTSLDDQYVMERARAAIAKAEGAE